MRESFLAGAASWGLCLLAGIVGVNVGSNVPIIAAAILAGLLTLVWLLHLSIFAARSVLSPRSEDARGSVAPITPTLLPRRTFVTRFAAAFATVALATAFGHREVFAQRAWYACNTAFCRGNACCPTSHPFLDHCNCQCWRASNEFSCGSYTQCNLDGSNCR
jgi:hypothetical protein